MNFYSKLRQIIEVDNFKSKLFVQKIDHQKLKIIFSMLCDEAGEVKPQKSGVSCMRSNHCLPGLIFITTY